MEAPTYGSLDVVTSTAGSLRTGDGRVCSYWALSPWGAALAIAEFSDKELG